MPAMYPCQYSSERPPATAPIPGNPGPAPNPGKAMPGGAPFDAIHTSVSGMIVRMPSEPSAVAIDAPRSPAADMMTTLRSGRTIASSVTSSGGTTPDS